MGIGDIAGDIGSLVGLGGTNAAMAQMQQMAQQQMQMSLMGSVCDMIKSIGSNIKDAAKAG
ncbi:hypothetical protein [Burkholderia cepacia]|uniref:hypothetical protein n=1 Tax=Burkholderia cepacia TaxID=292 RepID=UPI0015895FEC|nr:hypothetical protein [Burkholderia cepacia]